MLSRKRITLRSLFYFAATMWLSCSKVVTSSDAPPVRENSRYLYNYVALFIFPTIFTVSRRGGSRKAKRKVRESVCRIPEHSTATESEKSRLSESIPYRLPPPITMPLTRRQPRNATPMTANIRVFAGELAGTLAWTELCGAGSNAKGKSRRAQPAPAYLITVIMRARMLTVVIRRVIGRRV